MTLRTSQCRRRNARGDIFGAGHAQMTFPAASGPPSAPGPRRDSSVKEMAFAMRCKIGDTLCIYTDIVKVRADVDDAQGRGMGTAFTSSHVMEKVTDAIFVMVALDSTGKPTPRSVGAIRAGSWEAGAAPYPAIFRTYASSMAWVISLSLGRLLSGRCAFRASTRARRRFYWIHLGWVAVMFFLVHFWWWSIICTRWR